MNKIRRQSGVLVFLTPFLMVALAVVAVLAMDAARLYSVKADMQRVVNAAATAAADSSQACSMDADFSEMKSRALTAAKAVGFSGDESELEVFSGILVPSDEDSAVLEFEKRVDIQQTNAAVVRYTREEPISKLLPSSFFDPVSLSVNAASRKELYAVLSAGASTAEINQGLLGLLLETITGGSVTGVDATSLASLENTTVQIADLYKEARQLYPDDVATVADLMNLSVLELLNALVSVTSVATTPSGAVVKELLGATGLEGLDARNVLDLRGDPEQAMGAGFPLLDFVLSVVMNSVDVLSPGDSLLALSLDSSSSPVLSTFLTDNPLLGDVDVALNLGIDSPVPVVIGPAMQDSNGWVTTIDASDIALEVLVDIELAATQILGDTLSWLPGLEVEALNKIRVPLVVTAGGGQAVFQGADCARGGANSATLQVVAQGQALGVQAASIDAGGSIVPETLHATILKLNLDTDPLDLGLGSGSVPLLQVCLDAGVDITAPTTAEVMRDSYELTCEGTGCSQPLDTSGSTLTGLSVDLTDIALDCGVTNPTTLVSSILSGLVIVVEPLVETVTEELLSGIVSPLLSGLGVNLAGLKVEVTGADQLSHQLIENVEIK